MTKSSRLQFLLELAAMSMADIHITRRMKFYARFSNGLSNWNEVYETVCADKRNADG